jgi:hypothetical protein
MLWPPPTLTLLPECWLTKTVAISGCLPSHARTWRFHYTQCARARLSSAGVASENGQPVRVNDNPRQRSAFATCSTAARQCDAWLSPTRAIVPVGCAGALPNAQTLTRPVFSMTSHRELSRLPACSGVGTTASARLGFSQG